MSFSFSNTVLIKSSSGIELVASQRRNSTWAWSDFFPQFYPDIRAGNILQTFIIFSLQWENQSHCQNTHEVILKNELLIKTVIKLGPATSNDRNSVDFCGVRACLSWLQTSREKRQFRVIFAFHSPWDALNPFFYTKLLERGSCSVPRNAPCLLGNNFWSLNKWSAAKSALISVFLITPCFHHVQDFPFLFYREGAKLTALYMICAR